MAQLNRKYDKTRKALLAKIHIAIKQLDIDDEDYRDIVQAQFGVRSSKSLSYKNLEKLVRYFVSRGFKPVVRGEGVRREAHTQVDALKEKAQGKLEQAVDDGFVHSPRGLVKKICDVEDLKWCGDAVRLKKLLATIKSIEQNAKGKGGSNES